MGLAPNSPTRLTRAGRGLVLLFGRAFVLSESASRVPASKFQVRF